MDAAAAMDRQYRLQRYVYDWSRKYYLFGRDTLLDEIALDSGETLLEIGCGTARNLRRLACRHPGARLFGLDASEAMLQTARRKIAGTPAGGQILLRQGLADRVRPSDFGLDRPFDHVVFSYVLSMIPDWQGALAHALTLLRSGGALHVADFSDQQTMPAWFRRALLRWLHQFHVEPALELPEHLQQLASLGGDALTLRHLAGRYALIAHYEKDPPPVGSRGDSRPA